MKSSYNYLETIELQTAPAFILLIISAVPFCVANLLALPVRAAVILACITFAAGAILLYFKHKTLGFIFFSFVIGVLFFIFSSGKYIAFSNSVPPKMPAIMSGKIIQIIKQDSAYSRCLVSGWIDAKPLPKVENTGFIINIYGQKKYQTGEIILCRGKVRPVRGKILPTDFDEMKYAHGLNAEWVASASEKNTRLEKRANIVYTTRNKLYAATQVRINELFSPQTSAIINAMLLGDKSNLNHEIRNTFSVTGIAHILALSGLHVGIISAILLILLSFIENRLVKIIVFSLTLVAFVFFVGAPDSAVRAASMAILFMFARTVQRYANPLNVVSVVILAAALISPRIVYSISFQLSALSIVSIFLFMPVFKGFIAKFINPKNTVSSYIALSLAITLSVSIIISPLITYYFGIFSIISPIANLALIPLFSLNLVLSITALFFSTFSPPIANIYAQGVNMICECSINLANFAANFEFGAIKSSDFSTLILSILISIATVYVFSSIHKLQLILRVIISIVIISISINLFNECFLIFNLDNVEIYPKENYCVISIPLKHNKKFIWIADRKPNQKYYHDKALVRYINKNSSNIATIAYSGNFGKEFANSIATDKYAVRILDFSSQREIELRYLKGAYISKL